jgi:succinate-semialdehyde dehydrogenase/glutarate-semialdehyde dehydrogenase
MNAPDSDLNAPLGDLSMYIDGAWVESESGARMPVDSPGSGTRIGSVPAGTREDARRAIAAAAAAEETLRWMTPAERSAMCKRVAEALTRHAEELARVIALDQGKPYHSEAKWEAGACTHFFKEASEDILRLHGETLPSGDRNKRMISFWQSRGTYAVITPWNFPYNIPSEYISAALAAGNPIVWVPAPTTSACAVVFARAIVEADLPRGAFNLVTGEGPVVGDEIVSHPATRGVGFTGSPATGRLIAGRAAGKPLLLELGGNGPVIVLADANLDAAAEGIAFSAYLNAGQACSATERVLVAASVKDPLIDKVMAITAKIRLGDPFDPQTTMGPLNNEAVAAKMDRHIADAVAKGARLLAGGGRAEGLPTSLYYRPTVLDGVTADMAVNREESFGPIVPLLTFDTADEALRLANDNDLGLICSVYTRNLKAAFHFGERLRAGIVNINETPDYWETPVPYGGVAGRQSGLGRLGGMHTIKEMMDQRGMIIDLEKGGF